MKRTRLILPFLLLFLTAGLRAEDVAMDKLYEVSTGWDYDSGHLKIWVYEYSKIWFNGIRQSEDTDSYQLRPGDELQGFICGDTGSVRRIRLNRLTPTRAWFTKWTYAATMSRTDEGGTKFARGRLVGTESFYVDLTKPSMMLVDYGPNYVCASVGKTVRSK